MRSHVLRYLVPWLVPWITVFLVISGCNATRSTATSAHQLPEQNVAFNTEAAMTDVLDAATVRLVNDNFSISLANERIGLLQTDYASVGGLQAARADSIGSTSRLNGLQMRVTLNVTDRGGTRIVELKGAYRRTDAPRAQDELISRYWLERIAEGIATDVGVSYRSRITDASYAAAVDEEASANPAITHNNTVRAVAIVVAILFVITLVGGVAASGSN